MRIYALTCSTCGAPIEVPSSRRITRCRYCEASLVIVRDDEGAHTEPSHADDVSAAPAVRPIDVHRDDPRAIEIRRRIVELDEQWATDRLRFMKAKPDGRFSIYAGRDAVFTWGFVVAAALVTPVTLWMLSLPVWWAALGTAPLGYLLWHMEEDRSTGRDYRSIRKTYERERESLFNALADLHDAS